MKKNSFKATIALIAVAAMLTGCGAKEKKEENMATEMDATAQDAILAFQNSQTTTDADRKISMGSYDGDTYINEEFGFCMKSNSKWKLESSEEIAQITGTNKIDIDNLWSGMTSAYDQEISYCAIMINSETGSNICVSYVCTAKYSDAVANMSAKDYVAAAADGYEGSKITTEELAGIKFDCLVLPEQNGINQKMYCVNKNGIVLVITVSNVGDDKGEELITTYGN